MLEKSAENNSLRDYTMITISMIILIISTLELGIIGHLTRLIWLITACALVLMNIGAGLGMYIASVSLYAVLHFHGLGTIVQRPDNYLFAFLVLIIVTRYAKKEYFIQSGWLGKSVLILAAYAVLQAFALRSMGPGDFPWLMRMFGFPLVLFAALVSTSISRYDIEVLLSTVAFIGIYGAVISILERLNIYFIPVWITDPEVNYTLDIGRSGGLMMQSEWNGLALGLSLVAIAGLYFLNRKNLFWKLFAIFLVSVGIFVTFTRGAWLGVLVATIFMIFALDSKGIIGFMEKSLSAASIAFVVLMLALFPPSIAAERTGDMDTVEFRFIIWQAGMRMFSESPLIGHGFGSFRRNIYEYREEDEYGISIITDEGMVAHNTFVSILVEQGIIGLALYLWVIFMIYRKTRKYSIAVFGNSGKLWVTAFFAVYFINVMFIVAYESATNFIFYGILGFIAGTANHNGKRG